jgi:hypothetical protein
MVGSTVRTKLLEKYQIAIALGVRALVIHNLLPKDVEDFKKVAQSATDDDIFMFGFKRIPNFNEKFDQMVNKIKTAFKKELA